MTGVGGEGTRAVAFSAALARVARSVVPVVSAAVERLVALGASADTRRATLAQQPHLR